MKPFKPSALRCRPETLTRAQPFKHCLQPRMCVIIFKGYLHTGVVEDVLLCSSFVLVFCLVFAAPFTCFLLFCSCFLLFCLCFGHISTRRPSWTNLKCWLSMFLVFLFVLFAFLLFVVVFWRFVFLLLFLCCFWLLFCFVSEGIVSFYVILSVFL